MLRMHTYALTAHGGPELMFLEATSNHQAANCCGRWVFPLQCAGLLQADIAVQCTPEAILVRGSDDLPSRTLNLLDCRACASLQQ